MGSIAQRPLFLVLLLAAGASGPRSVSFPASQTTRDAAALSASHTRLEPASERSSMHALPAEIELLTHSDRTFGRKPVCGRRTVRQGAAGLALCRARARALDRLAGAVMQERGFERSGGPSSSTTTPPPPPRR